MPDKDSPAPGSQPKLAFAGGAGNPRPAISLHEEKKHNTEENETRARLMFADAIRVRSTVPTSAGNGDAPVTLSWKSWIGVVEGSIELQQ